MILTIPYKHDPDPEKGLLLKVLDEHPLILKNPNPIVRLTEFGPYGYIFMVRGYISSNTVDQWDIASDIRLAIVKVLKKHEIEVAQSTHLHSVNTLERQEKGF